MLIVHSALGSPGASTTALYLAAQWASTGTEVLLIEADPGGGSLGHHLGIHPTPGSSSFIASGLPIGGGNLVDHSQDVLLRNLHFMPSTSNPSDAQRIVRWLDERAEALRDVSASELALIIDAGRLSGGALGANLRSRATGVVVVARGGGSPTSPESIGILLSAEVPGDEVGRCVVTIGDSPLSAEEWREKHGIGFCGSIGLFAEVRGDLSAFLNRNKRKAKPWRLSLEEVAGTLLPYTKASATAAATGSQRLEEAPETAAITEPAPVAGEPATDAAGAGAAPRPVAAASVPGEGAPQPPEAVHAVPAEAATGVASPYAQLPPPFNVPEPAHWQPTSTEPIAVEPPPPIPEPPPVGDHPPSSQAPPPVAPSSQAPPPVAPPLPPHWPQDASVAQVPPPPSPPPAALQPPAHGSPQRVVHEPPPGADPQPDVGPSGSFRDWAARLHGSAPHPNAGTEG